jgi:biopolymer transport protein ExbD
MSGGPQSKKKGPRLAEDDGHLDLVPLIDCVFLILLFFMLCGRISADQRNEQITVPPTKTAQKIKLSQGWTSHVVNVFGNTQNAKTPMNSIQWNAEAKWLSTGKDADSAYLGYQKLRQKLDAVYDAAPKEKDPKGTGLMLPKVVIEIRADAATEYRVVQEIMQVVSDTISPFADKNGAFMQAKPMPDKPFVNLTYTTRRPGEQ